MHVQVNSYTVDARTSPTFKATLKNVDVAHTKDPLGMFVKATMPIEMVGKKDGYLCQSTSASPVSPRRGDNSQRYTSTGELYRFFGYMLTVAQNQSKPMSRLWLGARRIRRRRHASSCAWSLWHGRQPLHEAEVARLAVLPA